MDSKTKARLEAAGFKFTTVREFLGLTPEENELVETRVALAKLVHNLRLAAEMTQDEVAKATRSSQSRIAKAEANDPNVSVELLLRAVFALGGTRKDIARALAR